MPASEEVDLESAATRTLVRDGCTLSYSLQGKANGPRVVFIQGTGVHGAGWLPQVDALKDRYRCLYFDNRGIGASQPIDQSREKTLCKSLSIAQMTDDVTAIMDAEGWASAHVVGHSMGGLIALHLALTGRKRVDSLSLLCTFARGRDVTGLTPYLLWFGIRSRLGSRAMRRRVFLEIILPPTALAQSAASRDALATQMSAMFGRDLGDASPIVDRQLAAMTAYDASPRLGELAGICTLVVSATHDRIARPTLGRTLADAIPGSHYVEIPDNAHAVPVHDPEPINALLRKHFEHGKCETSGM